MFGSWLWRLSECYGFSLGRFAPVVFGWMIGAHRKRQQEAEECTNSYNARADSVSVEDGEDIYEPWPGHYGSTYRTVWESRRGEAEE